MNAIIKFLSGLSDSQRKWMIVAAVIVTAALFDRLLIGPSMSKLASTDEDIAKEEDTIKQDLRFLSYKDKILKENDEITPYLTEDKSSDNEMIASFLNKIQNMASSAKINLVKINPNPSEQDANYWRYQADVECTGTIDNVVTFMHAINSDAELMKVNKYNFNAKKSDTDDIKATMTIEKIVVPDKAMPAKADNAPTATPATP